MLTFWFNFENAGKKVIQNFSLICIAGKLMAFVSNKCWTNTSTVAVDLQKCLCVVIKLLGFCLDLVNKHISS